MCVFDCGLNLPSSQFFLLRFPMKLKEDIASRKKKGRSWSFGKPENSLCLEARARKQSISDFLDDDEKEELEGQTLSASSQFDTFGFTAAEQSRKQVEKNSMKGHQPFLAQCLTNLLLQFRSQLLLLKMGWRRGHSIKEVRAGSDARREARKAFLAFSADENTKENSDSLVSEPGCRYMFSTQSRTYMLMD